MREPSVDAFWCSLFPLYIYIWYDACEKNTFFIQMLYPICFERANRCSQIIGEFGAPWCFRIQYHWYNSTNNKDAFHVSCGWKKTDTRFTFHHGVAERWMFIVKMKASQVCERCVRWWTCAHEMWFMFFVVYTSICHIYGIHVRWCSY